MRSYTGFQLGNDHRTTKFITIRIAPITYLIQPISILNRLFRFEEIRWHIANIWIWSSPRFLLSILCIQHFMGQCLGYASLLLPRAYRLLWGLSALVTTQYLLYNSYYTYNYCLYYYVYVSKGEYVSSI